MAVELAAAASFPCRERESVTTLSSKREMERKGQMEGRLLWTSGFVST